MLLIEAARRALGDESADTFEPLRLEVSGMRMTAYRLKS